MSKELEKIHISVVMPCYRSAGQVLGVIEKIPSFVDAIYCVDDGCPDKTGDHIKNNTKDKRIKILTHEKNQGVGGAMLTGYKQALQDGTNIVVKLDSDGQMDPLIMEAFVTPIAEGKADYTKGNRFYNPEFLEGMPKIRIFGNAGLSFMNKFSTGYWQIFDPTNGYTAIHADVLKMLPLDKISKDFFFESDMLFRLGTVRAFVMDVPQKAVYGDEESNLKISDALYFFTGKHIRNFFKRIVYNYFIRDFQVASIEWVLGPVLLLFGLIFGTYAWIESIRSYVEATPGTVMLAALPFIAGLQLTLSALHFDILNQPKNPLHIFMKRG